MKNTSGLVPKAILHHSNFKTRLTELYGDQSDPYGFNCDTLFKFEIFIRYLYEEYFQVETVGIENIPANGRAILIGNHSGVIPIDAFLIYTAFLNLHPSPRRMRFLVHKWLLSTPGARDIIKGSGGVPATYKTAMELLEKEELVFFYPEGAKGTGKPFSMRYRLDDFDPGFVKAAIETHSPIIPITTVGGDEVFPLLGNLKSVARVMGTPYWPITATHPWLPFTTSCMPLPVKLLIKIDKPIYLDYPKAKGSDRQLRKEIAHNMQYDIQRQLNQLLKIRKSPFAKWDLETINRMGETNQ
jgi:1-acyl-sn-glycerol-3-phosphate acyltransferase